MTKRNLIFAAEPETLDPAEHLSRNEIAALQRERIRHTLEHAYTHVAHTRAKFDAAGVHPSDFHDLPDSRSSRSPPSSTTGTPTRSACSPYRASTACACTARRAPSASRSSSATRRTTS